MFGLIPRLPYCNVYHKDKIQDRVHMLKTEYCAGYS
jgi:hypothetical protein